MATQPMTRGGFNLFGLAAMLAVVALACAVAFAVVNAPPAEIGEHALERHGSQAIIALARWQRGVCTHVYRSPDYRVWIRLVDADNPLLQFGIIQRSVGDSITAYIAPTVFWAVRVAGYSYEGTEGWCGD